MTIMSRETTYSSCEYGSSVYVVPTKKSTMRTAWVHPKSLVSVALCDFA